MPTIETRIAPNGAKSYRAKVRKGAAPASASFAGITDARKWAQDTESAIRDGRYFKTAEANRVTLAEAIDRYVVEVLPGKPRTAKFQARSARLVARGAGSSLSGRRHCQCHLRSPGKLLIQSGPGKAPRGPATANRYMAVLSHLLSVAVREWEMGRDQPAQKLRKLKEPRGRERFLSEDECARLLAACRKSSNPICTSSSCSRFPLGCGETRSSCCGLSRSTWRAG